MKRLWKHLIIETTLKEKADGDDKEFSNYELAKGWRELKINAFRLLKDVILITAGVFSAAFGFKSFLLTNHFIDGGATGIALLASALSPVPLYLLIILVNAPFIALGFRIINKGFAIKTLLAITGLALVVANIHLPDVTKDNLLVAIFGGFFLGAGKGLAIRGGAVIDGTEVLAIYVSRKINTTIGDVVTLINILIFVTAAYFLSLEIALYSMITYVASSRTLEFVIEGIEEYTGVTIISTHSNKIKKMIVETLGRGVTVYNGKSGYGKNGVTRDIEIVYTVITRLELNRLTTEITKIDRDAFVVMSKIKDTKGGMIKKRALKRVAHKADKR